MKPGWQRSAVFDSSITKKRLASWYMLAASLAFVVVVIGAFVRLSDAGLSCPDWPTCHGALLPKGAAAQGEGELVKMWKEMIHRYAAGLLGLLVVGLGAAEIFLRRAWPKAVFLWALIVTQALLGMWTVTRGLTPVVVVLHLLTGLLVVAVLFHQARRFAMPMMALSFSPARQRIWPVMALLALAVQVALGGWVSANYAGSACPDFPTCQGRLLPPLHFQEAFAVEPTPPGALLVEAVLSPQGRMTIHMLHRAWAVVVLIILVAMGVSMWRRTDSRALGLALCILPIIQVSIGAGLPLLGLPLPLAWLHNLTASILLLLCIEALVRSRR
jgi:cytochrome c oxidase assembly protein subunit 15